MKQPHGKEMSCKGICIHHEAVKSLRGYRYFEGQKKKKAKWHEMIIATAI